jgi:conjugal transfer pilus assembly protein TraK
MIKNLPRKLLLATTFALIESNSYALQIVEARDGVAAEATLSMKEPTRIRIEGSPITDVFGNIYSYSSNCQMPATTAASTAQAPTATNPGGEIVVECDREKGEIYIRPSNATEKPINLFVSSATSTYTLLLRRADVPADTIVIRDKTPRQTLADGTTTPHSPPAGRAANHIRSLKALLMAMATDRVSIDIRVEEVNRPIQLWTEAKFNLMRSYEGRGLIGEKYQLTNISDQPMVLAEQEFDREDGQVVAIAIENHNLRSGESTSVYVIRLGS